MKNSILFFAVAVTTATALPRVVRAQETPAVPITTDAQSGYTLFLQAGRLFQPTPKDLSITGGLAPAEKLRRQRLGLARNTPALAKLREALAANIMIPLPQKNDGKLVSYSPSSSAASEFANQLAQEAAVRAADGDVMGAAQSSLDAMQLGAQVGHGLIINDLFESQIAPVGRKSLEKNASALDAAQSRVVAARLDEVSAQMSQLPEILNAEEAYRMASLRDIQAELNDPAKRAQAEAEAATSKKTDKIVSLKFALLEFSSAQIEDALHKSFGENRARAALPYAKAMSMGPVRSDIPYVGYTSALVFAFPLRFNQERDVVADRLLVAALRLHASKLESGAYPQTFEAGVDPFSPDLAPLIYKRAGDSYILYSVGPDGKDEDGAEIQTLTTDYRTKIKSVTDNLTPFSTGDIVAPVL